MDKMHETNDDGEFMNMLAPGREPNMTKPYKPLMAQMVENPLNPQSLKRYIMATEKMEQIVQYSAKKMNKTPQEVRRMVRLLLDEIGLDRNMAIIRWCGIAISYISKRITKGILIHETHMQRLRNSLGYNPVIYLPSHRSYMDFILMSYVFFHYDVEIPGITAGMDFHAMNGIGSMLRKTGAFFMRRAYSNGNLYWDVFREYVINLVANYHIGLEFFIEGTRSRNFKALIPKIGLLSMALEPYIMGTVSDITIIPISISYERVAEEQLFVYELLGVPKPKESTKGFFKALKIMDEQYGRIFIDFAEPISVKSALGKQIDRSPHTAVAAHLQTLKKDELEPVKRLANEVVYQQQRHLIIHLINLLCLSYSTRLYDGRIPISVSELVKDVIGLRTFLGYLEAPLPKDLLMGDVETLKMSALETIQIHSNTFVLDAGEQVRQKYTKMEYFAHAIDATKMKAHPLHPLTMAIAVPSLSLQLYTNPCLFWLARPAYVLVAALKCRKEQQISSQLPVNEELRQYAYELEDIFKYEFILDTKRREEEFERNLQILKANGMLQINGNRESSQISVNLDDICCQALLSTLAPFLCLYYQLIVTLNQELPNKEAIITNKDLLIKIQERVQCILLQQHSGEVGEGGGKRHHVHPYCLALDNINIALHYLVQDGYLLRQREAATLQLSGQKPLPILEQRLLNYCNLMPFQQYYAKEELQQQQQQQQSESQSQNMKITSKL